MKEESEGEDKVKFLDELISEKLGIPEKELFIAAAHNKPEDGEPPRSILVRLFTCSRNRESIAAWERKRALIARGREDLPPAGLLSGSDSKRSTWSGKDLRGKERIIKGGRGKGEKVTRFHQRWSAGVQHGGRSQQSAPSTTHHWNAQPGVWRSAGSGGQTEPVDYS